MMIISIFLFHQNINDHLLTGADFSKGLLYPAWEHLQVADHVSGDRFEVASAGGSPIIGTLF
jgi:hypothetical protein